MPTVAAEWPALEEFQSEGLITSVVAPLKSGKEATTYLCRAHRSLGASHVIAKVYHDRQDRNFTNDAIYQQGRVILNGQARRAVEKKTEQGRKVQGAMWVDHEYDVLCALYEAGGDVPEPYACTENAILMAFVGDEAGQASPQLQHAALSRPEAERALDRILWNVALWLRENHVHGDLSAFNVLWDGGGPVVIDFPQAVDPRFAPAAKPLLERDLRNISRYFGRHGLAFDHEREAEQLWRQWRFGRL